MKDCEHAALVRAETRPAWSAVTSEVTRVPPLLLLLLTNFSLIATSSFLGSGRRPGAASNSGSSQNETGMIQRVMGAAAPRLYSVAAAAAALVGALWQDVAVLAFVRLLPVPVSGPLLQVPLLIQISESSSAHTVSIQAYHLRITTSATPASPHLVPHLVQFVTDMLVLFHFILYFQACFHWTGSDQPIWGHLGHSWPTALALFMLCIPETVAFGAAGWCAGNVCLGSALRATRAVKVTVPIGASCERGGV